LIKNVMRTLILALVLLAFCSCNRVEAPPKTVKVEGTITHKGKPLEKGKVTLHPDAASAGAGAHRPAIGQISDGKFTLSTFVNGDGAIPGAYRITVESADEVSMEDFNAGKREKQLVPKKYAATSTSGLAGNIPDQDQPFPLALEIKD